MIAPPPSLRTDDQITAAVGANEDVARYSGISVVKTRTIAYVIQGACVAIAAICYVSRLGAATPTTGLLWELQAERCEGNLPFCSLDGTVVDDRSLGGDGPLPKLLG